MERAGLSQYAMSRRIGCNTGMVPRWLYGDTEPSPKWQRAIASEFGIPMETWGEKPTRPFTPPAKAA